MAKDNPSSPTHSIPPVDSPKPLKLKLEAKIGWMLPFAILSHKIPKMALF